MTKLTPDQRSSFVILPITGPYSSSIPTIRYDDIRSTLSSRKGASPIGYDVRDAAYNSLWSDRVDARSESTRRMLIKAIRNLSRVK